MTKTGLTFKLRRQELHLLRYLKDAADYGISISADKDALRLESLPVVNLSYLITDWTGVEILNSVALVTECARLGVPVTDWDRPSEDMPEIGVVRINAASKLVSAPDGSLFELNGIIPDIFAETYIHGMHYRMIVDFHSMTILHVGANLGTPASVLSRGVGEFGQLSLFNTTLKP